MTQGDDNGRHCPRLGLFVRMRVLLSSPHDLDPIGPSRGSRAVSSAVEHTLHTRGATGSIPVPPTIKINDLSTVGPNSPIVALQTIGWNQNLCFYRALAAVISDVVREQIGSVRLPSPDKRSVNRLPQRCVITSKDGAY